MIFSNGNEEKEVSTEALAVDRGVTEISLLTPLHVNG